MNTTGGDALTWSTPVNGGPGMKMIWAATWPRNLLATTDLGVVGIARRVGYDAEEAFSRAFKRAYTSSPSRWRAAHSMR